MDEHLKHIKILLVIIAILLFTLVTHTTGVLDKYGVFLKNTWWIGLILLFAWAFIYGWYEALRDWWFFKLKPLWLEKKYFTLLGTILINTWWMFVACAIIYSLIFQDTWETFWKSLS